MQRIAIIGAGGHGREQLELLRALAVAGGTHRVEGFVLDPQYGRPGERVRDLPVLGGLDWLEAHRREVAAVCAIGDSALRMRVVERLRGLDVRFETLVHPTAVVAVSAILGEGAIVCATAVLTSDVRLGAHVHVGVGSIVSHDCALGDYVSLAPGCRLAGAVRVGEGACLGVGTLARDRVTVGAWSVTGAGTVVVEDVPPDATVVGVPARVVAVRERGWQCAASEATAVRAGGAG